MGIKRTAAASAAKDTAKRATMMTTVRPATKKAGSSKTARKMPAKKVITATKRGAANKATKKRPTLATISAQLNALTARVEALTAMLTSDRESSPPPSSPKASAQTASPADFDNELLAIIGALDRRGRHSGLVPIPDVREAFIERGWTRGAFDQRLLQAEREFIVDLKAANDPARLAQPALAIHHGGRGHLQFVVAR